MQFDKRIIFAIMVFAVLLIAFGTFFWVKASGRPAAKLPSNVSLIVGVGTHGNVGSETKSLMSGVKYYRVDINLSSRQANQILSENEQFGAQYLGILDYETLAGLGANDSQSLNAWNLSVLEALDKYPEIRTWEIWNEPYVAQFQTGYMNGSAYNYYQMIKSAYVIIKSEEPNATVVCLGGAPIADYNTFNWYSQVWSFGAASYCDAISVHAYAGDTLLNQSGVSHYWLEGLSAYWNLTHKQIWITETGMPSYSYAYPSAFSQPMQNAFLLQDIIFFSNVPYVKRVYWFDLWGLSDGSLRNNFGLLNLSEPYSGNPGLAWHTFLSIYNSSASVT